MIAAVDFFTTVMQHPDIVALIGLDKEDEAKVYWSLAEEGTLNPFLVFRIEDLGPASKSGDRMKYRVNVSIYAIDLTTAVTIGSGVRAIVKNNYGGKVYDRGAKADYTDAEAKEAYMEIIYEFSL